MSETSISDNNTGLPAKNDNSNPQGGSKYHTNLENVTKLLEETTVSKGKTVGSGPYSASDVNNQASPVKGGGATQVKIPPFKKDGRKLFVGGVGGNVTNDDFRLFFEQFGTVIDSVVMIDRDTRRSRGFGFVTFEHLTSAQRVLDAGRNNPTSISIRGKVCEVKPAEPKSGASQERSHKGLFFSHKRNPGIKGSYRRSGDAVAAPIVKSQAGGEALAGNGLMPSVPVAIGVPAEGTHGSVQNTEATFVSQGLPHPAPHAYEIPLPPHGCNAGSEVYGAYPGGWSGAPVFNQNPQVFYCPFVAYNPYVPSEYSSGAMNSGVSTGYDSTCVMGMPPAAGMVPYPVPVMPIVPAASTGVVPPVGPYSDASYPEVDNAESDQVDE